MVGMSDTPDLAVVTRRRPGALGLPTQATPQLRPTNELVLAVSRPRDGQHSDFPWENLCFEGGGAKGYAYVGSLAYLEEIGAYPHFIRRTAGTSIGSLFAVLAAIGCPTSYIRSKVPSDFQSLARDGGGGRLGSFARAARVRGLHPGRRLYTFLGTILDEVAGSADITFEQLEQRFGRELCIPITNVTRMMTEYCHVKTTPKMPVRVAARISMSLPVLLEPVMLDNSSKNAGDAALPEVYVDGGLLCNNPTHVFDGWWLSRSPADSFFRRLQPLSSASTHYPRSARFNPHNGKSLGFTLFAQSEADISRSWVDAGIELPNRPDTPVSRECQNDERIREAKAKWFEPIQRLVATLSRVDHDSDGTISLGELGEAIRLSGITDEEMVAVFGSTSVESAFSALNRNDDDRIDFAEVIHFLEGLGIDVTTQLVGFPARHPKSTLDFALNMLEAVSRDLTRSNHNAADRLRTVPINTDYVGTTTFDLQPADLEFLVATGYRHTQGFVEAHRRPKGASE
ncbi:MAG: hypothetical protein RL218_637 [Actinomycetota bacterium]